MFNPSWARPSSLIHRFIMVYTTTLSHDDFVLLLDVLKRAQEQGIIAWSATDMICENTKIQY